MNKCEIALITASVFLGSLTVGVSLDKNVDDFWKILIPGLGSISCGLVLSTIKLNVSEFEKECNERIACLTQWEDSLILLESQLNQNIKSRELGSGSDEKENNNFLTPKAKTQ